MKPIVGIFAHPDDEAFGPAGTIATFAAQGRDVYLICVTDGDAGINSSQKTETLAEIRKDELLASSKVLGVKQVFFLDYKDGTLSNSLYHEIAEKLQQIIDPLTPEILLTMEPRGVSGHIDHVTVSLITTYLYERVSYVNELWYYCLTQEARALNKEYYIYFPPGYEKTDISKIVDVSRVREQKIQAMKEHVSQSHDMARVLLNRKKLPEEECFIILRKNKG